MTEQQAIEIIRTSESYQQAYGKMVDAGCDLFEADCFWAAYSDQCGADIQS